MHVERLVVEPGEHASGEYRFTPDELTLSVYAGPPLALEQEGDRRWSGTALHDDVKVMVPGQERVFRHRATARFVTLELRAIGARIRPRLVLRDPVVTHLVRAALEEHRAGSSRLFRDAAAHAIAARLEALEGASAPPPHPRIPRLERVIDYLHAHLAHDVSIDELAAIAGWSPSHFSAAFRASVGESPHRHLVRMRVERARRLLEEGATPAAAAIDSGFCDQSHLARHMRRVLGATPSAIARQRRRS